MGSYILDQLDKILALADSNHEGEAVVAVRKARQMLSKDGLSFSDLARAAASNRPVNRSFSLFSNANVHLETQIVQLRQKLDDCLAEMQAQETQLEFWRRRAMELEQGLNLKLNEAERWRTLARETAEKLWDLGQSITNEEHDIDAPEDEK